MKHSLYISGLNINFSFIWLSWCLILILTNCPQIELIMRPEGSLNHLVGVFTGSEFSMVDMMVHLVIAFLVS